MTRLCGLQGAWRRSLIVGADGARDDTTSVTWLQGPSVYADLRKPKTRVSFSNVGKLRDLDATQIEALAEQEGFAGILVQHPDHFEWTRTIDFQPPRSDEDRGTLDDRGHVMIEEGYSVPYIEHWHRETNATVETGALILRDIGSGCPGLILRVNDHFAFARGRTHAFGEPGTLLEAVRRAPSRQEAQNLIDCEISTGSTVSDWRIEHSTLPYREAAMLAPQRTHGTLVTADITPGGTPYQRTWTVVSEEGSFSTSP